MITIQQLGPRAWTVNNQVDILTRTGVIIEALGCFPSLNVAISHVIPPGTGKDIKLRIVSLGLEGDNQHGQ